MFMEVETNLLANRQEISLSLNVNFNDFAIAVRLFLSTTSDTLNTDHFRVR